MTGATQDVSRGLEAEARVRFKARRVEPFTHVGGEGSTQELLPLPLLGLSGVATMLEVLQSAAKVLDVVL